MISDHFAYNVYRPVPDEAPNPQLQLLAYFVHLLMLFQKNTSCNPPPGGEQPLLFSNALFVVVHRIQLCLTTEC